MSKFGFDKVLKNLQMVERELPKMVANDTKNYFLNSFKTESWDGKAWELPKRRKKKNPKGRDLSRILIQSGKLRRAVANSLKEATWEVIRFDVTDVNYAGIHNEGGTIQIKERSQTLRFARHGEKGVRFTRKKKDTIAMARVQIKASQAKIPQRQFMGQTNELTKIQTERITKIMDRIWG